MMRNIYMFLFIAVSLIACEKEAKKNKKESSFAHEVVAKEIIQVSGYTYVRSEENGKEVWLAAPSFEGKVGQTYYFNEGLEMVQFKSKELNRTFESILFLQKIHKDPNGKDKTVPVVKAKPLPKTDNIKIEKVEGVTTVAELFGNLSKFKGKKIRVKGKVTKFNAMIMNKNWIHLEDGTKYGSDYDLIITSKETFEVGDVVTLEGIVATNIDLGYGYKYKVLIQEAAQLIDL
ncbi:hypothetical protein [Flavicella sp.]|uniref:hypothetical protein n=1 Tax=Flavicella sp. TaxID=2957742 RepID=UPI00262379C6|nr:hypothetical protein [Flavicella sp.]MDG1803865.1 hypothetical protein [Flavicella sp.]